MQPQSSQHVQSLKRVLKDAFTHYISLKFFKFSSLDMILLCISFSTFNHLVKFDFEADNVKKDKRDRKIDMLHWNASFKAASTRSSFNNGDAKNSPSIFSNLQWYDQLVCILIHLLWEENVFNYTFFNAWIHLFSFKEQSEVLENVLALSYHSLSIYIIANLP